MIIVGIDPGTDHTGIAQYSNVRFSWKTIEEDSKFGVDKLIALAIRIVAYVINYNAEVVVIEDYGFGGKFFNVDVAELVGMIKFALKESKHRCQVIFLAPNTTKKYVTGDGRAKKKDMQLAIKEILKLKKETKLVSHEADAIALIVTYQKYLAGEMDEENTRKIKGRGYEN